jgi:hypothetical protein
MRRAIHRRSRPRRCNESEHEQEFESTFDHDSLQESVDSALSFAIGEPDPAREGGRLPRYCRISATATTLSARDDNASGEQLRGSRFPGDTCLHFRDDICTCLSSHTRGEWQAAREILEVAPRNSRSIWQPACPRVPTIVSITSAGFSARPANSPRPSPSRREVGSQSSGRLARTLSTSCRESDDTARRPNA